MKETKRSLHIWSAPPSFLWSSGCLRLSLWRLILPFGIVFPYTHVPSFVILHFMKFVSTSAGFKRYAQMCSRSAHLLFKRKRLWNELCGETTPHAKNFSQDYETQSYGYSTFSAISGILFHRPDSINAWCWFLQPPATLTSGRNDDLPTVLDDLQKSVPFRRCLSTKHIA